MGDEKESNPANLRSVKPTERTRGRLMDRETYEELVDFYIRGRRSIRELVDATGVAFKTAKKAIERGWPEKGWAPLQDRAAFYDKMHADVANKESPQRAKEARDFLAMREEYLKIAHGVRSGLAQCLGVAIPLIATASRTRVESRRVERMEEVLDKAGRVTKRIPRTITVDVEVNLPFTEIADAIAKISSALERTGGGELEQLSAKLPTNATGGRRKHNLSIDQLRFMAENKGALPPGVKIEDLGG